MGVERKGRRHITVWVSHEEEKPVPVLSAGDEGTLRFINRVSVVEKTNSGKGAVELEPLSHHFFVLVLVSGGGAKELCVVLAVLYSGSFMYAVEEVGLPCVQKMSLDVQLVFPYETELTVVRADGRNTLLTQLTCLQTALFLTQSAPMEIKLAVEILLGGDDVVIFGSRTLRE